MNENYILIVAVLALVVAVASIVIAFRDPKPQRPSWAMSYDVVTELANLNHQGTKLLHERVEMPWTTVEHYTAWLDNLIFWENEVLALLVQRPAEHARFATLGVFSAPPPSMPEPDQEPFPQWGAVKPEYAHQWQMHHRRLEILRTILDAHYAPALASTTNGSAKP